MDAYRFLDAVEKSRLARCQVISACVMAADPDRYQRDGSPRGDANPAATQHAA
jgi:hypothetical protein